MEVSPNVKVLPPYSAVKQTGDFGKWRSSAVTFSMTSSPPRLKPEKVSTTDETAATPASCNKNSATTFSNNTQPKPKKENSQRSPEPNSSATSGNQKDPFIDPEAVPLKTGWYRYHNAESTIDEMYHERYKEVQKLLNAAILHDHFLRQYFQFLKIDMSVCGRSPKSAVVTLVIICQEENVKKLEKFMNKWVNRRIWKPSSKDHGLWTGIKRLFKTEHPYSSPSGPDFELMCWPTKDQPWMRISTGTFIQAQVKSGMTLIGTPIRTGPLTATLAFSIEVNSKLYGLTVDHLQSNEAISGLPHPFQTQSRKLDISLILPGLLRLTTSCFSGGAKEKPRNDETTQEVIPKEPGHVSFDSESSHSSWVNLGTIFSSSTNVHVVGSDLSYLDWLLVDFSSQLFQRPNAVLIDQEAGPQVLLKDVFSGSITTETPVLVLSGIRGPRKAKIMPGTSYLGGSSNRGTTSKVWTISLFDGEVERGESGSLVVDSRTWTIYGYVVARGISSQAYITPMFELLNQIEDSVGGTVSIPDPVLQLAKLEILYKDKNDDLNAGRCTELLHRSFREDNSTSSRALIAAILEDNKCAFQTLLTAGADIDVVDPKDGCTALHIASRDGNLKMTELLLEKGAKQSVRSPEGHTPLDLARAKGHSSIIEAFSRVSVTTFDVKSHTAKEKGVAIVPPQEIPIKSFEGETNREFGERRRNIEYAGQNSRNVQFRGIVEDWKSGLDLAKQPPEPPRRLRLVPVPIRPICSSSSAMEHDSPILEAGHATSMARLNPVVYQGEDMTMGYPVGIQTSPTMRSSTLFSPSTQYVRGLSGPPSRNVVKHHPSANQLPKLPLSVAMKWREDKKKTPKAELPHPWLLERLKSRDHIFVVDDSQSMAKYWDELELMFSTLAYIVKTTDPDGLDLHFTMSDEVYHAKHTSKLVDTLRKREPKGDSDILLRLNAILSDYTLKLIKRSNQIGGGSLWKTPKELRPLNIYIFTDGVWQPRTDAKPAIQNVVSILHELSLDESQVGIQFIRFGHDPTGTARLEELDGLVESMKLPLDIVDTTPSTNSNLWKMLLGGFDKDFDHYYEDVDKDDATIFTPVGGTSGTISPVTFHGV